MTTARPLTLDDLRDMDACHAAVDWAAEQPDMETAWRTCARADWLIWALERSDTDPQRLRLLAADLAKAVLPIWEADYLEDDRPRKAIEAARALARGEITEEEARAAAGTTWATAGAPRTAAGTTSRPTRAAAWAAEAAARAAAWAADTAWSAARAAGAAAEAARAARAAGAAAGADNAVDLAAIVRRHFPDLPTITETP